MRHSRRVAGLCLVLTLAGCAHAPVPVAATANGGMRLSSAKLDAAGRAEQFANVVRPGFSGKVTVKGAMVTLTGTKAAPVTYDFTQAPATGLVTVTADGFSTTVSNEKLLEATADPAATDKILPAVIVPIAIDVAIGGAKALAFYWLTHRHDFNRDDAIKACVVGMASALLDFVPYGQYFEWLVPIAVDIISQVKVGDFKEIAAIAMKDVDKLVEVIKHILHKDPAPALAAV